MQLENAQEFVDERRLQFVHDIEIEKLDSKHFMMLKQLICLIEV